MNEELFQRSVPILLAWYGAHRREMPWRQSPTPYHVWISEIMLQQTRIEAVIPYYRRFLSELPTVEALAAVSDDKLMKLWEGLGYYSRARNLKKAAVTVVGEYGGRLPEEAAELKKLAGIGDYTAGAISSIAYGRPEPAVDGNVLRVAMRLTACGDDIAQDKTKKRVTEELRAVYPTGDGASALTQAIMELGEVVCLPNGAPKCGDCPLNGLCRAHAVGREEDFPVKSPKKERKVLQKTVVLLRCGHRYAIRKRGEGGLLAGTWEYPNFEGTLGGEALRAALRGLGVQPTALRSGGRSLHVFTHVEWEMDWFRAECGEEGGGFVWKTAEEIVRDYAVPTAFRHALRLFAEDRKEEKE